MNIQAVAEEIYEYTSGYPVLVSSICRRIDEKILGKSDFEKSDSKKSGLKKPWEAWGKEGIRRAVKMILTDNTPLFESMIRHLDEYPLMKQMFHAMLFQGSEFAYNPDTKEISLACMFGYADVREGKVQIANRIFETHLYNYFLSEEELTSAIGNMAKRDKNYFIHDGRLDMDTTLKKFVDYSGEQFIIELKIWYGNEYNERGERQLADYLEYYHKDKGYMLSFNFNKNKKTGINEIRLGNKTIVEAVV